MTPEQIEAWYQENGGRAGEPSTDANGVTTHRAANGAFITIRRDGGLGMRGHTQPPGETAQQTAPPVAPASAPAQTGGSGVNQEQLEALLAQIAPGGDVSQLEFSRGSKDKTTGSGPLQETVQVPWVRWIDRRTGRTVEMEINPGGSSYTEVFNGTKPENKQSPASTERPQNVPTNTTEPNIVTRMPDGSIRTDPNPNYRPEGTKPTYITGQDGTVWEVTPGQPPKSIIQGAKPGQIVNVGNGRLVRVDQAGAATVVYDDPTGEVKQDKDGNWVRIVNGTVTPIDVKRPADPNGSGPSMPDIIIGQSASALRQLRDQIAAEVASGRKSQSWGDTFWAQALQTANIAVQEAGILQRERESSLNASVNLATKKADISQSSFQRAMQFAQAFNDKLPVGSDLGGKAFVGMLGTQMLDAQRSGLYDIKPPTPSSAMSAAGQGVAAAASGARLNVPPSVATPPAAPAAPAADTATPPPTTPAAPGAPAFAPQPVAPAPSAAPSVAPTQQPASISAASAAGVPAPAINPVTGEPTGLSPLPVNGGFPDAPPNGQNQMPVNIPYPSNAGAQSMTAPANDFAALTAWSPPAPMTPPSGNPAAMLQARAASTPPWRLTDQEREEMAAAGIGDDVIYGIPQGRTAA